MDGDWVLFNHNIKLSFTMNPKLVDEMIQYPSKMSVFELKSTKSQELLAKFFLDFGDCANKINVNKETLILQADKNLKNKKFAKLILNLKIQQTHDQSSLQIKQTTMSPKITSQPSKINNRLNNYDFDKRTVSHVRFEDSTELNADLNGVVDNKLY